MRTWLVLVGAAVGACGSPVDPEPEGPGGPGFRIEPANVNLTASLPDGPSRYQFTAVTDRGEQVEVFWRLSNSEIGSIDADGWFTPCYGGGQTALRALLRSDTTRAASAMLWISQPAFSVIWIQSLTRTPGASPAQLDSLTGALDTKVAIAAGALNCSTVLGARLELVSGSTVISVGQVTFDPPPTASLEYRFVWSTAGLANGSYQLRSVLVLAARGAPKEMTSSPLSVVIRN